ncbi:hypothetical protein [uncultured Bacteroides sp.]|uniref:hypothetical protein n=1 Tax=uncultured Bacteroides sp. TaxID=162156 RepID=UPI002AA76917|nr:hypothetical protein [uncultured Bacteroides sp.]
METNSIEPFLILICVAGAVFSIALFIKVWIATNNISSIEQKLKNGDESFALYMIQDDKDGAYKYLVAHLARYLIKIKSNGSTDEVFISSSKTEIDNISRLITKTGHSIPDHLSTPEKFLSYYKGLK